MESTRNFKTPSRILVINTRRIGDALLATPLIHSLRCAWPEAKIDVLVFENTVEALRSNTDIDQVIAVTERPGWLSHLRLLFRLWRQYDIAISTLPADRPILYAWVAGRYRIGFVEEGRKHNWKRRLLSQAVPFDNLNTHTVLMNLKLADALCIPRHYEIIISWNDQDASNVIASFPFDTTYAVLHVYPMYVYKAWRREAWVELASWLSEQGMRIVLTGGKDVIEVAYVRDLLGLLPSDTVDVVGKLSLTGTACLLSKARVYIGPDTVVTHLAAALGIPTLALFGPSNPVKWGPWPRGYDEDRNPYAMRGTQRVNNVLLLQGGGDCVPCMEEGCEQHTASLSDCLQNLPAASVIAALRELLNMETRGRCP